MTTETKELIQALIEHLSFIEDRAIVNPQWWVWRAIKEDVKKIQDALGESEHE